MNMLELHDLQLTTTETMQALMTAINSIKAPTGSEETKTVLKLDANLLLDAEATTKTTRERWVKAHFTSCEVLVIANLRRAYLKTDDPFEWVRVL